MTWIRRSERMPCIGRSMVKEGLSLVPLARDPESR